ncbi:MAG: hypothetical protein NTW87_15605, partial [Planctomycetota bacterium]|nr:hypothetical protein [Planctomycetota bacterium]
VGLVLFLIGLIVAFGGGGDSPAPGDKTLASSKGSDAPPRAQQPTAPAKTQPEQPDNVRKLPSWMAPVDAGRSGPERSAPAVLPKAAPDTPSVAPAVPVRPPQPTAIVVPPAPNETIWLDDELPPGARRDGSAKTDSWRWVSQPDPVFSGAQSHTVRVWEGQKPEGALQHHFNNANPPLQVSPWDILFCYVYLDPKDPPKEIMMQWSVGGGWEHRAYWGEDLISYGTNLSPSRLSMGPLPKTGAWVRLEVRGGEIGIEAENEAVAGWSFDQFGGTVYWDRAGMASQPKPATVAAAPASPAVKDAAPATPAKAAPAPAGTVAAGFVPRALAKWLWKDFQGGQEYPNHGGKGKTSRTIFGTRTAKPSLWVTFELGYGRYGPGTLAVTSLRHDGKEPCRIAILINGQEVFSGPDPATSRTFEWAEHKFPIPSTTLRSGKNELRINNIEDSGNFGFPPWYGVYAVELQGALLPDFPPVVSEPARAALQTYDRVFELLARKDPDPVARLDQALRQAKSVTAPELQPLAAVLDKAQALYNQAVAALVKTPPTEQVQIEKLKLTGAVVRVAGGKAFIKSQGIEMPVDVSALPQTVFLKALAFDDSKAASTADKAAYLFGLGTIETAQQLLKRLKKEDTPAWAALFDQRAAFDRLLKFEAAVGAAESAVKSAKPADALPLLAALKKDYLDLYEANKERMNYLAAVAESAPK